MSGLNCMSPLHQPIASERENMSISSGQKKVAIIGAAVLLIAGAAFVFFDPLGLDLLGAKPGVDVVKPVATPRVAAPVAKPPAAAPKAAAMPTPVIAPVSAVSSVPVQAAATVSASFPAVSAPVATPSVAAQTPQSTLKISKTVKAAKAKPERSKSADLRDCLKLDTDAAIAKCAGE